MIGIDNIFNLIGISGIIVVIVTGFFNLFNGVYHKKLSRYIERNDEINKYRYTKLYEILLYISDMRIIEYNIKDEENIKKTIESVSNEFEQIKRKYTVVRSIFDKKYYSDLDGLFEKENEMSNDMLRYIHEGYAIKFDVTDISLLRLEIKKKLIKGIQEQIQELTNYTKK
jgi:hypothetical protein